MSRCRVLAALLLLSGSVAVSVAEDEIRPNENLVAEGIPTLPVTIAETVGPYTEFRSASFTSWHPVNREMLISTRFADTAQVHRVKSPGGDRTQLTFFPDRVAGAVLRPEERPTSSSSARTRAATSSGSSTATTSRPERSRS